MKNLELFVKDKRYEDGTRTYCLECDRLKRGGKKKPRKGYKFCAKCKKELELLCFNYRNINGSVKPFSYCKECERDMDSNRYQNTCSECGKTYRSGRKETRNCAVCYHRKIGEIGKTHLARKNANQFGINNFFYGVRRIGKANPNYNPEITDKERELGRLVTGYKYWRIKVYQRDNFVCQCCNDTKGGNLVAHHLNGWNWCKKERISIQNGITLCNSCHKLFHDKYGYGHNTKEQFADFVATFQQANTEITS
jgi:hypothetical protein